MANKKTGHGAGYNFCPEQCRRQGFKKASVRRKRYALRLPAPVLFHYNYTLKELFVFAESFRPFPLDERELGVWMYPFSETMRL